MAYAGDLNPPSFAGSNPASPTRVVNLYKEPYDVYIGRAGKGQSGFWGNPFKVGPDGTLDEVLDKFRVYVLESPELMSRLHELRGKRLGCFCKPKRCHGDILAELADTQ